MVQNLCVFNVGSSSLHIERLSVFNLKKLIERFPSFIHEKYLHNVINISAAFDEVQRQQNGNYVIVVEDKRTKSVVAAFNATVDKKFNFYMECMVTAVDMLIVDRHQTSAMTNL